tara:strand:- start:4573 stop:5442 length:870 start_codon:yes stop_codon:yes gene_type:complete
MKKINFFFFGFGQSAKYLVRELVKSKVRFTFCATNTKKTKSCIFEKKKFNSYKFKDNIFDKKLLKRLQTTDYILVSIPPKGNKDPVLKKFKRNLKESNFKKLIYLSATSVYGDHNGQWVNENSRLKGKTIFGTRRIATEKAWISFRKQSGFDVNILRVSGIYSKESNVLKKILNKNIYVKEKKFFSRIRIEDLAMIIKKTFFSSKSSMILNASDDQPSTNIEVAKYAAKLLKLKSLQAVPISKFKNKMIKEFYKDSKKVNNNNMKRQLKIKLKYPTYKHGLRNILYNFR